MNIDSLNYSILLSCFSFALLIQVQLFRQGVQIFLLERKFEYLGTKTIFNYNLYKFLNLVLSFFSIFNCVKDLRGTWILITSRWLMSHQAMENAGTKLVGEHDFRNFCKMDAANVHTYMRRITMFEIYATDVRLRLVDNFLPLYVCFAYCMVDGKIMLESNS